MSNYKYEAIAEKILLGIALVTLACLLVMMLTSCCSLCPKPKLVICPPPEVIRVEVPVMIPCPAPTDAAEYVPLLPKFDADIADIDSLLKTLARDYVLLAKRNHELAEKLKVYAAPTH
jgi:hypothetical protein